MKTMSHRGHARGVKDRPDQVEVPHWVLGTEGGHLWAYDYEDPVHEACMEMGMRAAAG
jgi:hypothetical protein